jgi:peroxiredoxin
MAILFLASTVHAQKVGDTAPVFSLTGLDGKTYTYAQYSDKVLVLYFLGYN